MSKTIDTVVMKADRAARRLEEKLRQQQRRTDRQAKQRQYFDTNFSLKLTDALQMTDGRQRQISFL